MVGLWQEAGLRCRPRPSARSGRSSATCRAAASGIDSPNCSGGDADADFTFGLDVFLDGFRSRLPVRDA